jgi:hypothetical protein
MIGLTPGTIADQWQYVTAADITDTNAAEAKAAKTRNRHYVTSVQVANSDTTPGTYVHLLSGSTVIWTGFISPYVVAAPGQSYIEATFPSPLRGGISEAINVKVESAAQIRFNVQGFTAKAS